MGRGRHLGELELAVLVALARLEEPSSARRVYSELVTVTERDLAVASVHVTLSRLVEKGFVGEGTGPGSQGSNRPVRHFSPTPAGLDELRSVQQQWLKLWDGVRLDSGRASS